MADAKVSKTFESNLMWVRLPPSAPIMHFLYILRSLKDSKLYIGTTNNLYRRLKQHNNVQSKSTKYRRPFVLIYQEIYPSKNQAMKREWYFKNTSEGNKLMRTLI